MTSYPLILELVNGDDFAGTMYAVMSSSATTEVYFSVFSTMWVERAAGIAGSIEDITQADLTAAKTEIQSVYALLVNDASAGDFTLINPLASAEMAIVHQVFDADSGAGNADTGYSGFNTAIDNMVTTLNGGGTPLAAITGNFETATSSANLLNLIQTVATSSTVRETIANAYPNLSTGDIQTEQGTINYSTSAAASLMVP